MRTGVRGLLSIRFTKFITVGAGNAAIDLLVLNLLSHFWPSTNIIRLGIYNTLAVTCSIANSYLWNRYWTFADVAEGSKREKRWFVFQALVNLATNDSVLVALSKVLFLGHFLSPTVAANISKAVAMFLSSSVSYLSLRLLVFRAKQHSKILS